MEAYLQAKAKLADQLSAGGALIVNADDPAWSALPMVNRRITFFSAAAPHADVRANEVELTARGSTWTLALGGEQHQVHLPLMGGFNVANALGAASAARALGVAPARIAERLSSLPAGSGRLELLHDHPGDPARLCPTPDALRRALAAVRPFTKGRLICVFGAGGDRDRGKRGPMGAVVAAEADIVIVTSDNPRTEDPERIIDDVVAGISVPGYVRLVDRRAAIARALEIARPDDVVLLAGKGHETYQVIGTRHVPFDEKLIVNQLLQGHA